MVHSGTISVDTKKHKRTTTLAVRQVEDREVVQKQAVRQTNEMSLEGLSSRSELEKSEDIKCFPDLGVCWFIQTQV